VWKLGFGDMKGVTVPRTRASPRRRIWISVVVIFIAITVLWAYLYPPQDYTYPVRDWFPSEPTRELTDAETAARVVFRQILSTPPFISRNPKIAFMFLTPGKLPFEKLWELFFKVSSVTFPCVYSCILNNFIHDINFVTDFGFAVSRYYLWVPKDDLIKYKYITLQFKVQMVNVQ
jgi:hypothetical protein